MLFSLSCVALALGYLIAQAVVRSKAGKVLIAIRDAESRTRFLGYRVENYKTYVFTLSACMAGVAGALYVPQVGIINPSEFAPANSIEMVIWVAVGGRGTLIGAALGAVIVNYLKTIFTIGALAPYWLFLLGAIFVLVTIFLPRGVLGLLPKRAPAHPSQRRARRSPTGGVSHDRRHRRQAARDHPEPALSQRRVGELRRLPCAEQSRPSTSPTARCAPSSARTAPARPR